MAGLLKPSEINRLSVVCMYVFSGEETYSIHDIPQKEGISDL